MTDAATLTPFFAWVVLPLLIFFARICDVTLGTIRVIFISKGFKYIAPVIGFFEVIIWLLAIGQVMNNVTNVASYIAYGAGFATGTFVGMAIEERLSLGTVIVRVITNQEANEMVGYLRSNDYGVTVIGAEGSSGPVHVLFMVIKRQDVGRVTGIIRQFQPNAFYSIEDVKSAAEGVFPDRKSRYLMSNRDMLKFFRKDK
ncbi:MAG: DUF2179 domain-containing protein [Methanoregulaceae archaeon]|jgi:uncharacterized protein YebE (UPF0316 family)|nr:DUF2179 domain-containing protein [Methanoregulaceae archaeon]